MSIQKLHMLINLLKLKIALLRKKKTFVNENTKIIPIASARQEENVTHDDVYFAIIQENLIPKWDNMNYHQIEVFFVQRDKLTK